MHLRYGQANDVIDSILEFGNFSLSTEIFKDVRLSHRDVDVAQIEQIVKIGSGTIGDDRKNPQIIAIIENLRQLVGKSHVSPRQLSAGDSDCPIVLSHSHCSIAATLLERLRHRLRSSRSNQSDSDRAEAKRVSERRNDKARRAPQR